jgi:multidrug efflux pump subunit AcrA (membrane-fusion protein)
MPDIDPNNEPTTPVQTEPIKPAEPTKPWGDDEDFDAEKAWTLIQNLRGDKAKTQVERDELAARVQAAEDAKLSEQEKVAKELEAAKAELAEARRKAVLAQYELPESALVFLTAESAEEIDKQASALAGLAPKKEPETPKAPGSSRVTPALPNGQTDVPEPFDPAAIARAARNRR